jgi:transcriptional regulator with XRE-family HTH domain
MLDPLKRLSEAITMRRVATGLGQGAFADQIGMDRSQYNDIELGKRDLRFRTLLRITDGFGITPAELLRDF